MHIAIHGDHIPLPNAYPYQLRDQTVAPLCRTARFWNRGPEGLSGNMRQRKKSLRQVLSRVLPAAEGKSDEPPTFSLPVPCGEPTSDVEPLILDHHMLRSKEGLFWLDRLSSEAGHRVICAADCVKRPRKLLEVRREALYQEMPIPDRWHGACARGEKNVSGHS